MREASSYMIYWVKHCPDSRMGKHWPEEVTVAKTLELKLKSEMASTSQRDIRKSKC